MNTLDMDDGEKVALSKPPVFDFSTDLTGSRGKIHVAILHTVNGGIDGVIVQKPIPISFDIGVKLEVMNNNQVDMVIDQIDEKSIQVKTQDITLLGLFQKKVKNKVLAKLKKTNLKYLTKREVVGSIPTPDDVMGIPLRLVTAKTNNGAVILYSTFEPKK